VAADSVGFYARKLIWPHPLAIDYGRSPEVALRLPWVNALLAVTLAAAAIGLLRRAPTLCAGLAIALAALVPYLGLIPFDFQMNSTVTDHYLYLAMLGPAVVAAYLLRDRATPWWILAGVLLLALAIGSFRQARTWRDSMTLFAHALNVNPDSFVAHHTRGFLLADQRDLAGAETEYRTALRLRPGDAEANTNIGNLLGNQNRIAEALPHYQRALDAAPRDTRKMNNLAIALALLGRYDQAETLLRSGLQIDGGCADLLHANLGNVLLAQGHREAAQEQFVRALELDPNSTIARNGLARIAASQK
jgi:Tfp pilus assembly protein PilF